jgi:hypothetical protein
MVPGVETPGYFRKSLRDWSGAVLSQKWSVLPAYGVNQLLRLVFDTTALQTNKTKAFCYIPVSGK